MSKEVEVIQSDNGQRVEQVRTPGGRLRRRVCTVNLEPSRTDQSQAKQTDVNEIVRKFRKTGVITHVNGRHGTYGDFTDIPDLAEALTKINVANDEFSRLPAQMRERFGNDPILMYQFLADSKNDEEAIKLGLKVPRVVVDPKDQPLTVNQLEKVFDERDKKRSKGNEGK